LNITFIGGGNMAASLIGGLVPNQFQADEVTVYDINEQTLDSVKTQFDVKTSRDLSEAMTDADIVVLAVKPQVLQVVCEQVLPLIKNNPLFISIAAGIRSIDINRWLGGQQSIVRCMPNTPSLLQCGATGLYANKAVSELQKQQAQQILEAVGLAVWVNSETDIDIVTAISGSGPAYFFLFIESLQKAGEALGLNADVASQLAAQTALGAANMALANSDVEKLRKNVTSKGGTTEQALLSFEQNDLKGVVAQAVDAAFKRSQQMADELSNNA
jgi:pyrroline-5-carboxylate reductase